MLCPLPSWQQLRAEGHSLVQVLVITPSQWVIALSFSFPGSPPKGASADVPVQQLPEGFLLQLAPAHSHLHPQLLQHLRHVSAWEGRVQWGEFLSQQVPASAVKLWGSGSDLCQGYGISIPKMSLGEDAPGTSKLDTWHWGFVPRKFQFPQRGPGKSPAPRSPFHVPQVHPLCTTCPQWRLCLPVFGTFGTATLPSAIRWPFSPGSSSVPHLELVLAWHHPPPCAWVLAQLLHRLVLCIIFWDFCPQQKGDPVPLTGGPEATPTQQGLILSSGPA